MASNPFDSFDPPAANPFDQFEEDPFAKFDKLSPSEQLKKDFEKRSEASIKGMRGVAEAGVGMLAGIPSQIAGGLLGMGTLLSGQGYDAAANNVKMVQDKNFGFGPYQPSTEEGKQASEKLGEAFAMPGELAGKAGALVGPKTEFAAKVLTDMGMNFLPLHGAKKIATPSIKESIVPKKAEGPNLKGLVDELTKPVEAAPDVPAVDPREAFYRQQALARQEAAQVAAKARGEEPILVDREGQAATPDQIKATQDPIARMAESLGADKATKPTPEVTPSATERFNPLEQTPMERTAFELENPVGNDKQFKAQDVVDERAKAFENEAKQLRESIDRGRNEEQARNPFVQKAIDNAARQEQVVNDLRTKVEAGEAKATELISAVKELEKAQERASKASFNTSTRKQGGGINPEVFKEGFQKIKELANGITLTARGTGDNLNITATRDGKHVAGVVMDRTNAYDKPSQSDMYAKMVGSKEKGTATQLYKFANELGNDIVPSGKLTQGGNALWNSLEKNGIATDRKIPFNYKKQGGGVRMDWSNKNQTKTLKENKGLRDLIGDVMPDHRTPEEFIAQEKNTPDISQNAFQRLMNGVTKGSLFQSMKVQSPLIQRIGTAMREANNRAKASIAEEVHGKLAPAAQALSTPDRTAIVSAMQLAEKNGKALTEETLIKHGFNEKQIDWWKAHTEVMQLAMTKMNEVMQATGHEPVSPRVAYLASKGTGDFRRLIYKEVNGEKTLVSMLGDDTRKGLDTLVGKLKEAHPEYVIGDEQFFGGGAGKGKHSGDITAVLQLIGKDDPNVKALADHVNDLMTVDAYNYMNAKSHTMQKKGILGMEGRKEFVSADQNAKDAIQAQIDYAEKIIKWAELTKASEEIKPLLHADNGLNMPKAKEWANEYVQRVLGNNPSALGRSIDTVFAELGNSVGIGPSIGRRALQGAKSLANGLLIGFAKPGFLAANMLQPMKVMPEMSAFLTSRGLDKTFDAGTGAAYLGKGFVVATKAAMGKAIDPVMRGALDYAKQNHVYSSDLFDSSNRAVKDVGHYWDKMSQFGTGPVEMRTRQGVFLGMTQMLHENGLTPKEGLYETAHNLTDMAMNNYDKAEAPSMYTSMGSVGKAASNLLSYKHNEYSRLAMFAREVAREGSTRPLATAIMSSIAFAGIMGTIGYTEANELVKFISKQLGKPTSLTKVLLDNPNIGSNITHGLGAEIGVDMSGQLGAGAVLPGNVVDAVMPGAGKLGKVAVAGWNAATSPSEFNTKNLVRELSPGLTSGLIDRAWFSKNSPNGEMAISRTTGLPTVTRNDSDKLWKAIGMTGINESRLKAKDWENDSITKVYHDIQKSLVDKAQKSIAVNGTIPADFAKKFVDAQGNPETIQALVTGMVTKGSMDHRTAEILAAQVANLSNTHKLKRMVGQE